MYKTNAAFGIVLVFALLAILKAAQSVLLPFIVALFLWALIWIVGEAFDTLFGKYLGLPAFTRRFSRPLAILTIFGMSYFVISGIRANLAEASQSFAFYQKNISAIAARLSGYLGFDVPRWAGTQDIARHIDIPSLANRFLQGFAGFLGDITMVLIYLVFMLMEENSLAKKLPLALRNNKRVKDARAMFEKIIGKIRRYLFTKLLTSTMTGVGTYFVMEYVGLDFSLFWAILMFLCNFIPTIGSIVSSAFPIALSLLQFPDSFHPFAIVLVGITICQIGIGSILDPRLMGKSINISPLVQILSLVVWGRVWGVMGMFLCMPIMIILTIVLYNIPSTKNIAILLSADGESV